MNGCGWGGGSKEEGEIMIQKTVETGGAGGLDKKCKDKRRSLGFGGVTVQGCNSTTS